eukprot:5884911-Amphidinium_carterae.1
MVSLVCEFAILHLVHCHESSDVVRGFEYDSDGRVNFDRTESSSVLQPKHLGCLRFFGNASLEWGVQ